MEVKAAIIIPARLNSTRLPEKLLLQETGKPLLQHTYESASRAALADCVLIAADHQRLISAAESFGARAVMTSPDHPSGTDRVAEAAAILDEEFDIIVNVQGDEPEIAPAAIDAAIEALRQQKEIPVATLACPIRDRATLEDPACVKVVVDGRGRAMYFSRSPIPHPREFHESMLASDPATFHLHLGLYAYRREFLENFHQLPPSRLQQTESLEQLRILEAGHPILVRVVDQAAPGIDTQQEYRQFVERNRTAADA